jgi:putative Holliday junction resolvase
VRYLGLDVGDARVGVAVSDETGTVALPRPTLERVGPRRDVRSLVALARENGVGEIVVGLPRRLDGSIGRQAEKVLVLVEDLRAAAGIPVVTWDERFTSVVATQALVEGGVGRRHRREKVDGVAAVLILQSYLDARGGAARDAGTPGGGDEAA